MSAENVFSKWLRREETRFEDNFKFALKSWQSVELTLNSKYQIILEWLCEQKTIDEHLVEGDFKELLKLRAQPGLLDQEVKKNFVDWCLQLANNSNSSNRRWCELLALLLEFEPLQDMFRINYELQASVYGSIFMCYEKYLKNISTDHDNQFLITYESEFLVTVLSSIKKAAKRCRDVKQFELAFTSLTLTGLINVLLEMRSFNIDFFKELLEIEQICSTELTDVNLMNRILRMPLHVQLLAFECAIVNRKGVNNFLELVISHVFLPKCSKDIDPVLSLTVAAYTIEMMSRHNVCISFDINGHTVFKFLGQKIFGAVKEWRNTHLKYVLMLLCASLRMNPLILEENIFEITVWIMLANKSGDDTERQLFEEYLVLLTNMFRRLSRAEKFVANLLKNLKEATKDFDIVRSKKRRSKFLTEDAPPKKKGREISTQEETDSKLSKMYSNAFFHNYFEHMLTQNKSKTNTLLSTSSSFPKLYDIWPSNPVGVAFAKILSGLVSKPSLVIWKTLSFSLKDFISSLKDEGELSEKSLFLLDLHVALLSQYFAGCKLAEQSEKLKNEIAKQLTFTFDVLQAFGKCLLEREHNPRTMTAFLEISFYATSFELMLIYYRSDGCSQNIFIPTYSLVKLNNYLTSDEWTLIRQRVLNFGKSSCKYLLYRLDLQKSQSQVLLQANDITKIETSIFSADKDSISYLLRNNNAKWLLSRMSRKEKVDVAAYIVRNNDSIDMVREDLDLLELVSLAVFANINSYFAHKNFLLKSLALDFEKLRNSSNTTDCEIIIKHFTSVISKKSEKHFKEKITDSDKIKPCLDLLSQIPLGYLRRQKKTIIFVLLSSLYHDLTSAEEEELTFQVMNLLKDLLHFGQQILIFKYFTTSCFTKLFPIEYCWDLYEFLFSSVKNEEKGTEQFLQGLLEILQVSVTQEGLNDSQLKLLLAAIDSLYLLSGPCAKRMRKYLDLFLKIFADHVTSYFEDTKIAYTSKKDKKFVIKTLSGFAPYASVLLAKVSKDKCNNEPEAETTSETLLGRTIDDVRRICKIYIGHSMDYRNPWAIRLMHVALNHRELLHLDQVEIEFVLTNYWKQITDDLLSEEQQHEKAMESAIKMIIGNKTNEDLLITLKSMAHHVDAMKFVSTLQLLKFISNCHFSTIKGAIFNEQYKQITSQITLLLRRDEQHQFKDHDLVLRVLYCHRVFIDNKMVPTSTDTIDSILSFLMDINIKKLNLYSSDISHFKALHMAMTDVCASLIRQRHILLVDRVPQYIHVYKDLVQSIVWYKSDRQKDTALPSEELDVLAELAMKLESLMQLIVPHSIGFKRIAPFILNFIINLMVANKRSTTLYNKVKTHIENICYVLIGICDHRVGRFILRCSSEAGRQVYELLVKDYQKYYKFKGKI